MREIEKDPLAGLFARLPQEKLSSSFREEMMKQIQREEIRIRKRNRLWAFLGIAAAVLCLAGVSGYAIMNINWEEFHIPAISWTPASPYCVYFLVLVGILLFLDYLFRKHYQERHTENIKGSR